MGELAAPTAEEFLDATATAVVAFDEDGVIRYANPRAYVVFGYADGELEGLSIEALVAAPEEEGGERRSPDLGAATARSHDEFHEIRCRRKDGTTFPAEVTLTPLTAGHRHWVAASVLDTTSRNDVEERLRDQGRTYLTLARVNEAVASAEDEFGLYKSVCHVAVVQGGLFGAMVIRKDPGSPADVLAAAGPLAARLVGAGWRSPRLMESVVADIRQGEPGHVFIDDTSTLTSEAVDQLGALGVRSVALLRLNEDAPSTTYLCLFARRPEAFTDERRALLRGAANNISVAADRHRARLELEETSAIRDELMQRLVDAQERERERIAADVHDESLQTLAAVHIGLDLHERRLADEAPGLLPHVGHLHDMVSGAIGQLRGLLFELDPLDTSSTLTDQLRAAAAYLFDPRGIRWTVDSTRDTAAPVPLALRTQAHRIAKEAMVNAAKHARPTTVAVTVDVDGRGLTVRVTDDGIGLGGDVQRSPLGHRGLTGMQDRARAAGGHCRIDSTPGQTTVTAWLPLPR